MTRLAPSPTGALHLGNARTFVINWLLARKEGWRITLRIEDLDGPRVKVGADEQAIEDLRWLGLDWDAGPIYQSARKDIYDGALQRLLAAGAAYPCVCSRREAEAAASAPHAEDQSAVYPGTCRGKYKSVDEAIAATGRRPAIRFLARERIVQFNDGFKGAVSIDVGRLGDFIIAKADGTAAYQLAVVVDDAESHVTDVVRGDDLLESAARQMLVYEALGLADQIPRWIHLPLVIGTDGRRLAKRHGDTRLAFYRERGVSAGQMRAALGRWCGIECGAQADLTELLAGFELQRVPREPIVFDHSVFNGIFDGI